MAVELAVTAGPNAGRSFRFADHASFIVGRSLEANFLLPDADPYVSRFQFLVEVNPPLVRLRDMGSKSGTWVNGTKLEQADLRDGDEVRVGMTTIAVRIDAPPPTLSLPGPAGITLPQPEEGSVSTPILPNTEPVPHGFRIIREIGRGGMGVVYEGRHSVTGQAVAVKTIHPQVRPSDIAMKKFLREAEIVRQLDHPHIVKYVDGGEANGIIWFAMEFVPGEDAGRIVAREKRLPVGQACRLAVQLLEALAFAHGKGFVHRDVKPSNVLVTMINGKEHAKLADFGLARAYEASAFSGLTLTGAAGGTPHFMPPEQVRDMRSAKPAADIYAAGATLYRLLAGVYPYPTLPRVEQMLKQILETDPISIVIHVSDLPAPLVTALHRALARDPKNRFPDAESFAAAIRPYAQG